MPRPSVVAVVVLVVFVGASQAQYAEIPHQEVENWAWRFGRHLYELGKKITYLEEIAARFASAKLDKAMGDEVVKEMVGDIEKMMMWKMQAVQRIIDTAEQAMKGHEYQENLPKSPPQPAWFYNAKTINTEQGLPLPMTPNKRFENIPVNVNQSTVHVATNVYTDDINVLNAIKWSKYLTPTFISNYEVDPTSLWQYFGSATGFLRHFPGVKLLTKDANEENNYDSRMRPWYIEAASSPKDVVILLDTSGSMTGLRKEIAKQVVVNLLETMTHNDHVAVLKFSQNVSNVVECFEGRMVPANKENLELIKDKLTLPTTNIANFSLALVTAFELLLQYNESAELGSNCNQALMIVTDGSPYMFDDIFNTYNQPDRRIRVFTYLIGREVTEDKEVKWMACAHRGYFTHVTTLAEVREQVEKYIPVMARPMVIAKERNYIWTPVYADISDPKISKWLFEMRERAKKKARILRKMHEHLHLEDEEVSHDEPEPSSQEDHQPEPWQDEEWQQIDKYVDIPVEQHQLMTSLAAPVFDLLDVDKQARLLGVAGTDVPVKDILKLAPPHKIGVNGYPFIITNNGHLLYHPDLRPMFEGLLKLDYSTVDLAEVELLNNNAPPWANKSDVMRLRNDMINRKTGSDMLNVKVHYDNMKRVTTRSNRYFYAPLNHSPFSFGIALPEEYGQYRVRAGTDIGSANFNVMSVFEGSRWKIHPDWVYCAYNFPANHPQRSPEENLVHFLMHIQNHKRGFKEKFYRVKMPLDKKEFSTKNVNNRDKNEYFCDRELIQSVIFDAMATNVFGKKRSLPLDTQGHTDAGFARKNGVTITFVATRSGLTRWEDLLPEEELGNLTEPHFSQLHNRAIDEVWYKRAVDHYVNRNKTSFVFSVPFDAARRNDTYVTGSHAIFVKGGNNEAPAAVVGLQFKHSVFAETFLNYTSTCQTKNCATNCSSDDLDCYLLDDNGFVIYSERPHDTGKFFGEVDGLIMQSLLVDKLYVGVQMYDYQAVCKDVIPSGNSAPFFTRPLDHVTTTFKWLWRKLALLWIQYSFYNWWNNDWLMAAASEEGNEDVNKYIDAHELSKKRMRPCNMNFTLYRINMPPDAMKPVKAKLIKCHPNGCDRPFSVQQVPYTNLVLLAVDATCPCESSQTTSITPNEMLYPEEKRCEMLRTVYHRRRPEKCYDYHVDELQITECGRGCMLQTSIALLAFSLVVAWSGRSTQHMCS